MLAGANTGSFGLWQAYTGYYSPLTNLVVSANAQATWAKGDYPYTVENGMFTQKYIVQILIFRLSRRNKYDCPFY